MASGFENKDNEILWTVVAVLIFGFISYRLLKPEVIHVLLWASYYENKFFYSACKFIFDPCYLPAKNVNTLVDILSLGKGQYNISQAIEVRRQQSLPFAAILGIPLFVVAFYLYKRKPFSFTNEITMEELELIHAEYVPGIRPMIGRGYENRLDDGSGDRPFAEKPWVFAIKNKILRSEEGDISLKRRVNNTVILKPKGKLLGKNYFDEAVATRVISSQLGMALNGTPSDILKLSKTSKSLIVAFLSELEPRETTHTSAYWFEQFNNSFWEPQKIRKKKKLTPITEKSLNVDGVDEELKKMLKNKTCQSWLSLSGFEYSLLFRLMESTSLSVTDIRWHKNVDRTGWYALVNVGRTQTYHVENLAAPAHSQQEIESGNAEHTPRIKNAVAGLKDDLIRHKWLINN